MVQVNLYLKYAKMCKSSPISSSKNKEIIVNLNKFEIGELLVVRARLGEMPSEPAKGNYLVPRYLVEGEGSQGK